MATIFRTRANLQVGAGLVSTLITHYWDSTGAAPAALVSEALARVRAEFQALSTLIGNACLITLNPVADEIDEATGSIVGQTTGSLPAALSFTASGFFLPLQTQGLLSFSTGAFIGGRRLRGRQYIPGLTVASSAAQGQVQPTTVTALNAACTALGTTVVTPMNQRVWHRPGPLGAGLSAIVTARTASGQFAVLRSRRA